MLFKVNIQNNGAAQTFNAVAQTDLLEARALS